MADTSLKPPGPSFLWPGAVVAIWTLYGLLFYSARLESLRPRATDESGRKPPSADVPVSLRLWDDPLESVESGEAHEGDHLITFESVPLVVPVCVPGGRSAEAHERRLRLRYAVLSGLTTAKYRPTSSQLIQHFLVTDPPLVVPYEQFLPDDTDPVYDPQDDPHHREVIVCWLDEDRLGSNPLFGLRSVLAALVSQSNLSAQSFAGQTAGGQVNALNVRVIGPANTDTLLAMSRDWPMAAKEGARFFSPTADIELQMNVRFYSSQATVEPAALKKDQKALVRDFTARRMPGTTSELMPADGHAAAEFVNVIGTDWHLAHAIAQELKSRGLWPRPHRPNECIVLVTDRDTLYGRALPFLFSLLIPSREHSLELRDVQLTAGEASQSHLSFYVDMPTELSSDPATVHVPFAAGGVGRCVCSGDRLSGTLDWQGRRLSVSGSRCAFDPLSADQQWDLQVQSDQFGRDYLLKLSLSRDAVTQQWTGSWTYPKPLVVFKYLRGIDGKLGDSAAVTAKPISDSAAKAGDAASGFKPTGTAQLDYLRRLEAQMVQMHAQQRGAGGRGILAVGVCGTDVYDKLLTLRSLRRRLPNASFFTTDLDAEFWRPSELAFTQNLIVASHFGLQLHPSLQRDVLPFRDSYQTSTFLAVLLALDDDRTLRALNAGTRPRPVDRLLWPIPQPRQLDLDEAQKLGSQAEVNQFFSNAFENFEAAPAFVLDQLQPLTFEVGRQRAYQMTMTGGLWPSTPAGVVPGAEASVTELVHPPSPRELPRISRNRWAMLLTSALLVTILLCVYLTTVRQVLLQAGKVLLMPVLVVNVLWWHRRRAKPVSDNNGPASAARNPSPPQTSAWPSWLAWLTGVLATSGLSLWLARTIVINHVASDGEPFELLAGVSIWPSTVIRFVAGVLSVWFLIQSLGTLTNRRRELLGAARLRHRSRPEGVPGQGPRPLPWLLNWLDAIRVSNWKNRKSTREILREYAVKGSAASRLTRTFLLTLVYLVFTLVFFQLTDGFPNWPARNAAAANTGRFFMYVSVFACTALTFFTIDALYLCRRFVTLISESPQNWSPQTLQLAVPGRAGRETEVSELATIRVIALRTHEVARLQIYPCLMLLILILARHAAFDGWSIPWPLPTVMLLLFSALVMQSLALRRAASKARENVLLRLQSQLSMEVPRDGSRERPIKQAMEEIQRESNGAYRPLSEDYLFRAVAIPLGGTGSLLTLEQLLRSF